MSGYRVDMNIHMRNISCSKREITVQFTTANKQGIGKAELAKTLFQCRSLGILGYQIIHNNYLIGSYLG